MVSKRYNKQRIRYAIWLLLPIILLLSSIPVSGQEQQSPPTTNQNTDKPDVACPLAAAKMVMLEVQVQTRTGLPVVALTHTDFVVFEDKVKQGIDFFIAEESGSGVYKIGYYPTNIRFDGEQRKIRVKVVNGKQQGWKIRYNPKTYIA